MDYESFKDKLQNLGPELNENYQLVIIKTLVENGLEEPKLSEGLSKDDIKKELGFYNEDKDSVSDIGFEKLEEKKLIKKNGVKYTLELGGITEKFWEKGLELVCICNKKIYFQITNAFKPMKINPSYFMAGGPDENWINTFKKMPTRWGVEVADETNKKVLLSTWNQMEKGDVVIFYSKEMKNNSGEKICFGVGIVKKKYEAKNDEIYYIDEERLKKVIWKYRIDIDPIFCNIELENNTTFKTTLPTKYAIELNSKVKHVVQRAFFHFTDTNTIKEIIKQLSQNTKSEFPLQVDFLDLPLKQAIKEFDSNENIFGTKRKATHELLELTSALKKDYLDEIDKITIDTFTPGFNLDGTVKEENFGEKLRIICDDVSTPRIRLDHFGVQFRMDKPDVHVNAGVTYPDSDKALDQIKEDLKNACELSEKPWDDVEATLDDKGCVKKTVVLASMFAYKPDRFLPILNDPELNGILTTFGIAIDDSDNEVKKQRKLLEVKNDNEIMKKWSNYDFAVFAKEITLKRKDRENYVLCRFVDTSGEEGETFEFSDSETYHEEIQNNTRIIFFDLNDEIINWKGDASLEKVTRKTGLKNSVDIEKYEKFGEIEAEESITLKKKLEAEQCNFDESIIPITRKQYEMIIASVATKPIIVDKPLELPRLEDIQKAKEEIADSLIIDPDVIDRIVASLYSGKSVLLTGPIGCGKTNLATVIPKIVWKKDGGYYPEIATATADWTTQDVIGGIVPTVEEKNVQFVVKKGVASQTVSENWEDKTGANRNRIFVRKDDDMYRGVWLVIDEFNRADIDKAFGSLFTALEYRENPGIKIPTDDKDNLFETLVVPKDFRIIGTLNTKDKNYLFQMSDALKRRFEIIEITPPKFEDAEREIEIVVKKVVASLEDDIKSSLGISSWSDLLKNVDERRDYIYWAYEILAFIRTHNNLGTALLISVIKFMLVFNSMEKKPGENYSLDECLDIALCNSILPQIEKLSLLKLETIKNFVNCDIHNKFDVDYNDDFESNQRLKEFTNFIAFMKKHQSNKITSIPKTDSWAKNFKDTSKKERKLKSELVKYGIEKLYPWEIIRDARGMKKLERFPALQKFSSTINSIMKDKGFEEEE